MKFSKALLLSISIVLFLAACDKDKSDNQTTEPMVFFENNFDKSEDWLEFDNEWAVGTVTDGEFHFETKIDDSGSWYHIWFNDNTPPNFTMETAIELLDSSPEFTYGLSFFRKDNYNFHYFFLSHDSYILGYLYNYNDHRIFGPSHSESIHTNGGYNILKLVKDGNTLEYYINQTRIYEHEIEFQSSNGFGFKLMSKGKIAIDYIKVQE